MITAERKAQLEPEYLFRWWLDSMNCHYALVDERIYWLFTIQSYFSVLFRYLSASPLDNNPWCCTRCDVCWGRKIGPSLTWSSETERNHAVTCKRRSESFASLIGAFCVLQPARCEPEKSTRRRGRYAGVRRIDIFVGMQIRRKGICGNFWGLAHGTRLGLTGLKNGDEKQ